MRADRTLDLLPAETAEVPVVCRDTPHQQPEWSAEIPAVVPENVPRRPHRRSMRWAMFALLPLALIGGAYRYVTGGQVMSTDDAYVNAETVGISTDVSGIVQQIDVTENQHVDNGQVLYRLDTRQFQIAVDNARANLAQTALTIASMKQDYGRMLSDVTAQQAQVTLDQATYDRNASLVGTGAVSRATYDQVARSRQGQTRITAPTGRGAACKARRQSGHSGDAAPAVLASQGVG
jgi:membrane fusion protein (multidrug efflux system)